MKTSYCCQTRDCSVAPRCAGRLHGRARPRLRDRWWSKVLPRVRNDSADARTRGIARKVESRARGERPALDGSHSERRDCRLLELGWPAQITPTRVAPDSDTSRRFGI